MDGLKVFSGTLLLAFTLTASSNGDSSTSFNCTFQWDSCGWSQHSWDGPRKWILANPRGRTNNYLPKNCHTPSGGMCLVFRSSKIEAGASRMRSKEVHSTKTSCLSVWYFMNGPLTESLTISRISTKSRNVEQLFTKFGPQGDRWYRAAVNVSNGSFVIEIEATGHSSDGNIVIDDITITHDGPCDFDPVTLAKDQPRFDCDFEEDLCSWSDEGVTELRWQVEEPDYESSKDRYPLLPRTTGKAYALLIKEKRTYTPSTRLLSPLIVPDGQAKCMSFWFKSTGNLIRQFNVKIFPYGESMYNGGTTLYSRYQHSLDDNKRWTQVTISLPTDERFRVILLVDTNYRFMDDSRFYIDEMKLTSGDQCKWPLNTDYVTCDFEIDTCGWYMESDKDTLEWQRNRGPTPNDFTGPSSDHTSGEGYYLYMDATKTKIASLTSTKFEIKNLFQACFSFWYYMHGADIKSLELRKQGPYAYREVELWKMIGDQGDQWLQQNITLDSDMYSLVFVARRTYFPRGDIAIDDISLTIGAPCYGDEELTTTSTTTTTAAPPIETSSLSTPTTTRPSPPQTPTILKNGPENPIYNNSYVQLKCVESADDIGTIDKYYWFINWDPSGWKRLYGHETNVLTFEEIQPKNNGTYVCLAISTYGLTSEKSEGIELKVISDPRPAPRLAGLRGGFQEVGRTIALVCGNEDVEGADFIWRTNSLAFKNVKLPNSRFLHINYTVAKHNGDYSCRLKKDEYLTGKSNILSMTVVPGKECTFDYSCSGSAYTGYCKNQRCVCKERAVIRGNICLGVPFKPKISVHPDYKEFASGESFYLTCNPIGDVPLSLTYKFTHPKMNKAKSFEHRDIIKITNATSSDSGYYSCQVFDDGLESSVSDSVNLKIKDFIDLDCTFEKNFCNWSNGNGTANFTRVKAETSGDQVDENSSWYIQSPGHDTTRQPARAMLKSATIDRTSLVSCLSFRYRLDGSEAYSLKVWKYSPSTVGGVERDTGRALWQAVGDEGEEWKTEVVLVPMSYEFYLMFESIGSVQIDHVHFSYRGHC